MTVPSFKIIHICIRRVVWLDRHPSQQINYRFGSVVFLGFLHRNNIVEIVLKVVLNTIIRTPKQIVEYGTANCTPVTLFRDTLHKIEI
jgi:hypothetical protein